MKLYVKFAQERRPRTIRLFLKQYYSYYTDPYIAKGHDTHFDPACTRRHCGLSYRSFDDLYDLVKTYYPTIRKKKIMNHLLTIKIPIQNGVAKPHLGICSTMNRIRFIPYRTMNTSDKHLTRRMPNSANTWMELLNLIGITSEQELLDYINKHKEP